MVGKLPGLNLPGHSYRERLLVCEPPACLAWACRCDWDEALEGLPETCSQYGDDGELLFKGLSAEVGIYEGQMAKVCPHTTTGRADYFGMAVNRAARFMSAARAGQVYIYCHVHIDIYINTDIHVYE